jgi:hypothetical protein
MISVLFQFYQPSHIVHWDADLAHAHDVRRSRYSRFTLIGESMIYIIYETLVWVCVNWVPRHLRVACPQVADGGDGLQIWRVAGSLAWW